MSSSQLTPCDSPMRRLTAYFLGLVVFASFGFASVIVYSMSSRSQQTTEDFRDEIRLSDKRNVVRAQREFLIEKTLEDGESKQVPPSAVFKKLATQIVVPPKKSATLVPGSKKHKELSAKLATSGGDGFKLYQAKTCNACHGIDAKHPISPLYPMLVNQSKEYLLAQMKDIKSGKRNNGNTLAMKAIIANVSDAEMDEIAQWVSEQKIKHTPNLDAQGAALFMQKQCATCHGEGGNTALTPIYPNLLGQNNTYLLNQMKDIKSGARRGVYSDLMKPFISNVSEDEMSIIADWLSQPQK